ncbi:proteasome inhibitor PI31 subunit-like [Pollicipes pollicipes]|uniref:proteasome inhibitor PI31 subunit-like n=1 Tax=Pollicipes pollicipes TaxID=41117 RepID=UPI0018848FF7|nr:proteasome inhibitor PI31 subunit-like [Pollicipes pollicipes]
MTDPFFGLELTHYAHKSDLRTPADAALLFVHWTLASSGLQAEHPAPDTSNQSPSSERLPDNWSSQDGIYELTYVGRDRSRYLMKALVVEGQLIVNMSKIDSDITAVFNKPIAEMAGDDLQDYVSVFKDIKNIKDEVVKSLVEAMAPGFRSQRPADAALAPTGSAARDRQSREPAADPLRVPGYGRVAGQTGPLAVGGADLDPLGRGIGGGMLMDPRRPPVSNLPPGVPPGARFDPFGPPGLGPRPRGGPGPRVPGEPDPDHLRMPGYDNMFM